MTVNRTAVARCVASGTLGPAGATNEIWSTSFWVAAYGGGANPDNDLTDFEPLDYLQNHAEQFFFAMMANSVNFVTMTEIKVNVFDLVAPAGAKPPSLKQRTDPTVGQPYSRVGLGDVDYGPYIAAMGWALASSTQSRGRASKGRMFFPPASANTGSGGNFTNNGAWTPTLVAAVSASVSPAWTALLASTGSGPDSVNYLPSLVSLPTSSQYESNPSLLCNAADVTTVENNVWSMRSRKNALTSGGVRTTHPSFD